MTQQRAGSSPLSTGSASVRKPSQHLHCEREVQRQTVKYLVVLNSMQCFLPSQSIWSTSGAPAGQWTPHPCCTFPWISSGWRRPSQNTWHHQLAPPSLLGTWGRPPHHSNLVAHSYPSTKILRTLPWESSTSPDTPGPIKNNENQDIFITL